MLTIEHAPPESLGGSGGTLTCKECNSTAGTEIDAYLVGRLREIESRAFMPETETRVKVTNGGVTVQGKIAVDKHGTMTMTHDIKLNHPGKLADFIERVNPDTNPLINIQFNNRNNKTDFARWQVGLLKSAYLLIFKRYGYSFILDSVYDIVRKQIRNPKFKIYPGKFWIEDGILREEYNGINLSNTPMLESIYCVFSLQTSVSKYLYGIHLPIPMLPAEVLLENLHRILANGKMEFSFEKEESDKDFLFNIENIDSMQNWFYRIRNVKIGLYDKLNIPTAINYLKKPVTKWEYNYYFFPPKPTDVWPPRLVRSN
ncbi:hypothetical protein [Hymenobacter terrestris]|uniref:HNH endonuclease 5 domain-containing protein n=1 Tax=Hymenobacter terrestris TaxID=2748310 RepID=A0ABX2PZX1_9BACT|nr:hypothetical protein [Hymenobacter terrestris]NVO84228.1 hypothetical protein [Hymenobacter terrestris]